MAALNIAVFQTPLPNGQFCFEAYVPDALLKKFTEGLDTAGVQHEEISDVVVFVVEVADDHGNPHSVKAADGFSRIRCIGEAWAFSRAWVYYNGLGV